jgi:hypothetical protein
VKTDQALAGNFTVRQVAMASHRSCSVPLLLLLWACVAITPLPTCDGLASTRQKFAPYGDAHAGTQRAFEAADSSERLDVRASEQEKLQKRHTKPVLLRSIEQVSVSTRNSTERSRSKTLYPECPVHPLAGTSEKVDLKDWLVAGLKVKIDRAQTSTDESPTAAASCRSTHTHHLCVTGGLVVPRCRRRRCQTSPSRIRFFGVTFSRRMCTRRWTLCGSRGASCARTGSLPSTSRPKTPAMSTPTSASSARSQTISTLAMKKATGASTPRLPAGRDWIHSSCCTRVHDFPAVRACSQATQHTVERLSRAVRM